MPRHSHPAVPLEARYGNRYLSVHRGAGGESRDPGFDNTIPLLSTDGYAFVSRHCQNLGTDIFATRIMLRNAYCTCGREAAEQFYFAGASRAAGRCPCSP